MPPTDLMVSRRTFLTGTAGFIDSKRFPRHEFRQGSAAWRSGISLPSIQDWKL